MKNWLKENRLLIIILFVLFILFLLPLFYYYPSKEEYERAKEKALQENNFDEIYESRPRGSAIYEF